MPDIDFTDLESFLTKVMEYAIPAKEPTLFAVGGRGYFENPASDLLAFFLKPDEQHGLKDLFLSTFLECIGVDHKKLDMSDIGVQREVPTKNGNKIDLQILGRDWCLLIENKIRHWDANPFSDYEAHAKPLREMTVFSILSPDGHETNGWTGVSYPAYCKALGVKMPKIDSSPSLSKWHLFANEFILHMKNELDNPSMTNEQATFVEKYAKEFMQAQKLLKQYPNYLRDILKEKVEEKLGYKVEVGVASWAITIRSPERWGKAWIAFMLPPLNDSEKFYIGIYPDKDRDGELTHGRPVDSQKALLNGMRHEQDQVWVTIEGFENSEKAINNLIPRIKLIEPPVNS